MHPSFDVFLVLALLAVTVGVATQSPMQLVVEVGEVRELDVGYKIGYSCDDVSILRAWMVNRGSYNAFVVEGVAEGTTWCRVGTDPNLPSFLFEVVVQDASDHS
jgi:hypothetical protein